MNSDSQKAALAQKIQSEVLRYIEIVSSQQTDLVERHVKKIERSLATLNESLTANIERTRGEVYSLERLLGTPLSVRKLIQALELLEQKEKASGSN